MTCNDEILYEFLQIGIGGKSEFATAPTNQDWNSLFTLAEKQALLGICFAGVQRLPKDQVPDIDLLMEWLGQAEYIKERNAIVNNQCIEIQKKLQSDGFRSCILKGQGAALNYLDDLRDFRQSGDIDVWVEGEKKDIIAWAQSVDPKATIGFHHAGIKYFDDTSVEVHFTPCSVLCLDKNKYFKQWVKKQSEKQFCNKLKDSPLDIVVPTDEFNLVYMLVHMHRHFFSGGLGLRQIMDYYFVLKNLEDGNYKIEEKYCIRERTKLEVEKIGLTKFACGIIWVIEKILDTEIKVCPWSPNEVIGKFMLDEIMRGGNFGHYDEEHSLTKGASHAMRFLEQTKYNLRFMKYFPKEGVWSTLEFIRSFFYRVED